MSDPAVFPGYPRVAIACRAVLGEGAIWDHRSGTLLFVDIKAHRLWRWRPGGEAFSLDVGDEVAFALLTDDPDIVLIGLRRGVASLRLPDGVPRMLLPVEPDRPGNRLNDGCAAPDGSLFLGTMDDAEKAPTGGFYRWGPGGLAEFGDRTVVTNGPAIDAERRLLYRTDTTRGIVYRHPLGSDGTPGGAEVFVRFASGWGHPDGMTVDGDGHVWICHWGDARVTRFSPGGRPELIVRIPTGQPTKPVFGGPDLATLYVTTAATGRDLEAEPAAGHVFAVETGIRGVPAAICRMGRS